MSISNAALNLRCTVSNLMGLTNTPVHATGIGTIVDSYTDQNGNACFDVRLDDGSVVTDVPRHQVTLGA